jgi:hypothetical protein
MSLRDLFTIHPSLDDALASMPASGLARAT